MMNREHDELEDMMKRLLRIIKREKRRGVDQTTDFVTENPTVTKLIQEGKKVT